MNWNWFWKLVDWRKAKRKFNPAHFCGAGNVNHHLQSDPRKETAKLVKAGVDAYHVEAFQWASTHAYGQVDKVLEALEAEAFWCKRRGLGYVVCVSNDNIHLRKHENVNPVALANHLKEIEAVFQLLKKLAWPGLFVQPTGETQTAAGATIEGMASRILPKSMLVSNSNGGRPRSVPSWASFAAYHAAKPTDSIPSDMWDVTDHGTLLNILGGTQAQDYKDDVVFADARLARDTKHPYILYMFQQQVMSQSDLKAVADGYYGK